MRCKVKGCLITTRNAKAGKCWSEKGMCPRHAIESYPEMYKYKLDINRNHVRKIGVRGKNNRFANNLHQNTFQVE